MKVLKTVKLNKTSGKETIARADDVFSYIDSDFENWNTDVKGKKTEEMELAVCEMTEDGTFKDIFTKPEEMCLTQHQIIDFVKNHKSDLRQEGWYTFFLFKAKNDFFVAGVGVYVVGGLLVRVRRFSRSYVWHAEHRPRFVLPQLALSNLDSSLLDTSDTLSLEQMIEKVKEAGYKVVKEM